MTRNSIESQRKGVVFVMDVAAWMKRDKSGNICGIAEVNYTSHIFYWIRRVTTTVPTRMVAIHPCWPNVSGFRILNMLSIVSAKLTHVTNNMARMRMQMGTEIEMRYNLNGYGIPIHLLPLTETGAVKVKYFHEWLRIRKTLEAATKAEYDSDNGALGRAVVCPGLTDVVFRQGTPSMKNPGNVIFRDAMNSNLEDYHSQHMYLHGHHQQPGQIEAFVDDLIRTTENNKGGLFLEWDRRLGVWVKMMDRQRIKNKVTIAYRDATKRFLSGRRIIHLEAPTKNSGFNNGNDVTMSENIPDVGSYSFMEKGNDSNDCCSSPRKRYRVGFVNGVPLRKDSNYNESGRWF